MTFLYSVPNLFPWRGRPAWVSPFTSVDRTPLRLLFHCRFGVCLSQREDKRKNNTSLTTPPGKTKEGDPGGHGEVLTLLVNRSTTLIIFEGRGSTQEDVLNGKRLSVRGLISLHLGIGFWPVTGRENDGSPCWDFSERLRVRGCLSRGCSVKWRRETGQGGGSEDIRRTCDQR